MTSDGIGEIRWHTVDGPAKSKSPVEDGGKHPIIYRVSSILLVVQDFFIFRNHPQYVFFHLKIGNE